MEVKPIVRLKPRFINWSIDELLQHAKEVEYTSFYLPGNNTNSYFFKLGNDYYVVNSTNIEFIKRKLDEVRIDPSVRIRPGGMRIKRTDMIDGCVLSVTDLMDLYNYNHSILVDGGFTTGKMFYVPGTTKDFLQLVHNVLDIQKGLEEKHITLNQPTAIMKYIYDKYKMEASYWNPGANYGKPGQGPAEAMREGYNRIRNDDNRVLDHPADYLGLINDKYATCSGLANGLMSIYRYFNIDASTVMSGVHEICKINLIGDNKERYVTYVDLSREITYGYQDNKYTYVNGVAKPRTDSNRRSKPNSYDFFMKRNAGVGDNDKDWDKAIDVDYASMIMSEADKPKLRVIAVDDKPRLRVTAVDGKPKLNVVSVNGIPKSHR